MDPAKSSDGDEQARSTRSYRINELNKIDQVSVLL
jgi:hypothetical protein